MGFISDPALWLETEYEIKKAWEYTDVSELWTASFIALIMEAVRTYETSVYSYDTTRRYIP
jgi:hypothetical protein